MSPSVVVAGESLVDLIVHHDGTIAAVPGGGPFNTARTMARLGIPVAWLGRLSNDRLGQMLRARLVDDGVSDALFVATDDPTTLALAELDAHGAASYRFYFEGTSAPGLDWAAASRALGPELRALHVGTLGLVFTPMADALARLVADAAPDVLVMIDPNCRPLTIRDREAWRARLMGTIARADVVKVSTDDLDYIDPGSDHLAAARRLVDAGARVVLLTAGADALRIVTAGWTATLPTPAVTVADTVGAGDAFGGGFLAGWLERGLGRDAIEDRDAVEACARRALLVAAITCERRGAEPPTRAELEAAERAGR